MMTALNHLQSFLSNANPHIPHVPIHLETVFATIRNTSAHQFILTPDPIHISYLTSPAFLNTALLASNTKTASPISQNNPTAPPQQPQQHTLKDLYFFAPISSSDDITKGVGACHAHTIAAPPNTPSRPNIYTSVRFVVNHTQDTALFVADVPQQDAIIFSCTKITPSNRTFQTRSVFQRSTFLPVARSRPDMPVPLLMQSLLYFVAIDTERVCNMCAAMGIGVPLEEPVVNSILRSRHPLCTCATDQINAKSPQDSPQPCTFVDDNFHRVNDFTTDNHHTTPIQHNATHSQSTTFPPTISPKFMPAMRHRAGLFRGMGRHVVFRGAFPVHTFARSSVVCVQPQLNRAVIHDIVNVVLRQHTQDVGFVARADEALLSPADVASGVEGRRRGGVVESGRLVCDSMHEHASGDCVPAAAISMQAATSTSATSMRAGSGVLDASKRHTGRDCVSVASFIADMMREEDVRHVESGTRQDEDDIDCTTSIRNCASEDVSRSGDSSKECFEDCADKMFNELIEPLLHNDGFSLGEEGNDSNCGVEVATGGPAIDVIQSMVRSGEVHKESSCGEENALGAGEHERGGDHANMLEIQCVELDTLDHDTSTQDKVRSVQGKDVDRIRKEVVARRAPTDHNTHNITNDHNADACAATNTPTTASGEQARVNNPEETHHAPKTAETSTRLQYKSNKHLPRDIILQRRKQRNRLSAQRSNARVKAAREAMESAIHKGKERIAYLRKREMSLRVENLHLRKRVQGVSDN